MISSFVLSSRQLSVVALLFCGAVGSLFGMRPDFGFYPQEAYELKQTRGDAVFFVDVRDPVEIQFTGFSDVVDLNIPMLTVDRSRWNESRHSFVMQHNPHFVEQVRAALAARDLDEDTLIITMCRSGSARGEPSAKLLREAGFSNAHFVIHGFEGDGLTEGPQTGHRLVNGWKNANLPWGYDLNPAKIFRSD